MNTVEKPLVNRVAASGIITIDLEQYFPEGELCKFDLKDYLFMELILKEKDFREALQQHNWEQYIGKNLCVYCSTDAIIPMWAYMLVASCAAPYARWIVQGDERVFYDLAYHRALAALDITAFTDKRVVVKGCSDRPVPPAAYTEITRLLQPVAKSVMFGEPCSTVPVFKRK